MRTQEKLDRIRDKVICNYRKSGYKIKAISILFRLTEKEISQITSEISIENEKELTEEGIFNTKIEFMANRLVNGYSLKEIQYMLGERNLFRDKLSVEEINARRDNMIVRLRERYGVNIKGLSLLFKESEASVRNLTKGIKVEKERDITQEIGVMLERGKKVYLSYGYTEEEFRELFRVEEDLAKQKNLTEQSKISESDINFGCYVEIERIKQKYESELKAREQLINSLELKGKELREKLEGIQKSYAELNAELYNQSLDVISLELQNANLIREIEGLKEKESNSKRKRYTKAEKERMIEVYNQYFRNAKKAIEVLHREGIQVGYTYLLRIVKERK